MNRKRSRIARLSLAERLTAALTELRDALATGRPLEEFFTVHTVEIPDLPRAKTKRARSKRKRTSHR